MNKNLYCLFQRRFPTDANKPFLIGDDQQLLYGDLDTRVGKLHRLFQNLGMRPGDRVVVQVEKSQEAALVYLACLRSGAIFVPLNTAYTGREVAYFLGDASPRLFICRPESLAELRPLASEAGVETVLTLGEFGDGTVLEESSHLDPVAEVAMAEADDVAAILYTSGTTGRSKGAMLTHRNLASNAVTLHKAWAWEPSDVLLHALPIFHAHGLFVALHCALLNASTVYFMPKFHASVAIHLMVFSTVFMGVPTFYSRLLDDRALDRTSTRNIRLFISGSAPLLEETFSLFEERTGHRILERYGMTESLMVTSNPYDGRREPGTVGFALSDITVRIADENGSELPQGETGVLEFTGPNVFPGYWNMPGKTATEFRDDGYFISGDIAVMDEEGRVSIVGRAKDLIISGGYNVYPKEVEGEIDALEGVKESAVIGAPHPDFGEGVVAIAVRDSVSNITEEGVIVALQDRLARFKQPKRVIFVDELPRNAMGKVQKNTLRDEVAGLFTA